MVLPTLSSTLESLINVFTSSLMEFSTFQNVVNSVNCILYRTWPHLAVVYFQDAHTHRRYNQLVYWSDSYHTLFQNHSFVCVQQVMHSLHSKITTTKNHSCYNFVYCSIFTQAMCSDCILIWEDLLMYVSSTSQIIFFSIVFMVLGQLLILLKKLSICSIGLT